MTPIILVAVDGSSASADAFRLTRRLAEREGARVEVLAVHDPGALSGQASESAVRVLREAIRRQMQEVGDGVERWPLTVRVGGVARLIAARAVDIGAPRVVFGINQSDSGQRWRSREILLDLIRRLNVPVLAVPPGHDELPRSVLVAIDFSRYSLEIAREALEDLEPGAQLHLVNVLPEGLAEDDPDRLALERQLSELATELELPGIAAVQTHLCVGEPAEEILRVAEKVGAELIASGSHGLEDPEDVATGDVYGGLVQGAACALLIGPPRGLRLPRPARADDGLTVRSYVA